MNAWMPEWMCGPNGLFRSRWGWAPKGGRSDSIMRPQAGTPIDDKDALFKGNNVDICMFGFVLVIICLISALFSCLVASIPRQHMKSAQARRRRNLQDGDKKRPCVCYSASAEKEDILYWKDINLHTSNIYSLVIFVVLTFKIWYFMLNPQQRKLWPESLPKSERQPKPTQPTKQEAPFQTRHDWYTISNMVCDIFLLFWS